MKVLDDVHQNVENFKLSTFILNIQTAIKFNELPFQLNLKKIQGEQKNGTIVIQTQTFET